MLIYSPETHRQSCKIPHSTAMALITLIVVLSFRSCMLAETASNVRTLK